MGDALVCLLVAGTTQPSLSSIRTLPGGGSAILSSRAGIRTRSVPFHSRQRSEQNKTKQNQSTNQPINQSTNHRMNESLHPVEYVLQTQSQWRLENEENKEEWE